jgi:amino acid transporter
MASIETEPLLEDGVARQLRPRLESPSRQKIQNERAIENDILQEASTVGRTLGWGSCYILVISRVIGSGIFAMPGTIVQNVGSPGLALSLWVLGAFVAWAALAIDMEYGCMLPRSGGVKVYLEYTYRHPRFLASTLVAVHAVLLGFTASNCIVFAKYTLFATGTEPTDLSTKLLAVGLLTAITVVHGCFRKTGILIQDALGWVKVTLIIFMILTGLFVVTLRPTTSSAALTTSSARTWELLWRDSEWGWSNITTAFLKIFYSYAGLSNINNVLNEVKNPIRTLKTVGPAALFTACVMYLLANVAYLAVVPLEDVKSSKELIAALFFERVFGFGFGNVFLPLAVALSAVGNVMVVTFSLVSRARPTIRYSDLINRLVSTRKSQGKVFYHMPAFLLLISRSALLWEV